MEKLKSYLTFKIGAEHFAANAAFVHNIIELPQVTEIPEMPPYMLGVINLRGTVLPVIDSRIKFGIKNTEITTNTCIIVMEVSIDNKQVFIGTLVDSVAEVIDVEDDEIMDTPTIGESVKNDFILGVFQSNDKFTMILDMNKVLSTKELIDVHNISSQPTL